MIIYWKFGGVGFLLGFLLDLKIGESECDCDFECDFECECDFEWDWDFEWECDLKEKYIKVWMLDWIWFSF